VALGGQFIAWVIQSDYFRNTSLNRDGFRYLGELELQSDELDSSQKAND
jgi:hypothetical protein